jgi:signal transduction histidine kinase/CheY-like chemotaxis protein/AraC-like DNA-binding protein
MNKFKLFLLCFFIFLSTTAQNSRYQILDSLNISQQKIYNQRYKLAPKEFSKLSHQYLNKLNSIEKRYKQTKKKKNLKKIAFNFDLQEIYDLKAKTYLEMMHHAHGVRNNIDSIDYYRNKILSISNDLEIRGKSHSYSGYSYYNIFYKYSKSIEHYNKALQILEFPENKDYRPIQIRVLVNLNASLLKLKIIDQVEKNYARLEETILDMSSNKRYKNLKELLKIEKAFILIHKQEFEESLKILNSVDKNNLDRYQLKHKYYDTNHRGYLGSKNYSLGEYYFDKAYPKDKYKGDDYYFSKLRYAIGNNNIEKADLNYKKIKSDPDNSIRSKIASNYFELKKENNKVIELLKLTLKLKKLETTNKFNEIEKVFNFYNDFSRELAEMTRLNELKDQKIIDNQLMYIKIGVTILLVIIIILIFVEWAARKKRYLAILKQKSQISILEAKEQFLENMSHEIRTPITSILGYLSLLKEENLIADKRLNFTNNAIDNTKKMMSSLDNFLNLTSLDGSSKFKKAESSIKINDFTKEIKSTFTATLEIKKIKLYFKTNAEDSLIINYDIESLTIIINNLVSNAIKYSNTNTSIYLTMYFEKSKLNIMVKDEGFGIADNEKDNIFSRFYQTESNISNSGFGIGLSLTNNLVKKLSGKISLETALNVGSVFKVELPLIIDNYNLNTTQIDENFNLLCCNYSTEIDKKNNLPKALVVDDNTEMIIYLKEIFSDFLDCTFAFNGKEALTKIEKQSFDIIISDLKMPIMNGMEFKNALNEKGTSKGIPFIFMTSVIKDNAKDINLLSFEDYIEKPFKKDEIISRIQFALEKTLNRKKLATPIDSEIEFESSSSELIKKVKNCILKNITNPDFNVIALCELCGYGQKKLNEILKSKIGLSIVNTILEIRLLKAYDLIIKNRYETLKEVVYAVGINSRPYFNKKFELRFGIKPGDLRKKYKN